MDFHACLHMLWPLKFFFFFLGNVKSVDELILSIVPT
jgi:hypothetical protein